MNVAEVIEQSDEFVGALLCGSMAARTADELSDIDMIVLTGGRIHRRVGRSWPSPRQRLDRVLGRNP